MINILFCGNDKVFDGMLTCALSIMKRTDTKEPFCFYVYTMDVSHIKDSFRPVSDDQMSFFENVIKAYNPEHKTVKIDVTDIYMKEFFSVLLTVFLKNVILNNIKKQKG